MEINLTDHIISSWLAGLTPMESFKLALVRYPEMRRGVSKVSVVLVMRSIYERLDETVQSEPVAWP